MTIEQLRAVYQTQPFRPFTIHLADGEKLDVPHADFLSHSPSGRTLIVYGEDDSFSIVDLSCWYNVRCATFIRSVAGGVGETLRWAI